MLRISLWWNSLQRYVTPQSRVFACFCFLAIQTFIFAAALANKIFCSDLHICIHLQSLSQLAPPTARMGSKLVLLLPLLLFAFSLAGAVQHQDDTFSLGDESKWYDASLNAMDLLDYVATHKHDCHPVHHCLDLFGGSRRVAKVWLRNSFAAAVYDESCLQVWQDNNIQQYPFISALRLFFITL